MSFIQRNCWKSCVTHEGAIWLVAHGKPNRILPGYRDRQMPAHVVEIPFASRLHDTSDRCAAVIEHGEIARRQNRPIGDPQNRFWFVDVNFNVSNPRPILFIPGAELDSEE